MINKLIFISALLFVCVGCCATTLDWESVDWVKGETTQTFYDVQGSGVDVTVTLSLSEDTRWHRSMYGGWYEAETHYLDDGPDDTSDFSGDGTYEGDESLYLGVDFASDKRKKSYLDVQISFSKSVSDLDFSLFDVDCYGTNYVGANQVGMQFQDVIEQIESEYDGQTSNPTSVQYDSSKIKRVNRAGSYRYQGNTDPSNSWDQKDNPSSTLQIGFENPVNSISFRYTTTSRPVSDPGQQAIGLSNITFQAYNAVPEASTYLMGGVSSLCIVFSIVRKRRQKREVMPS